MDEKLQACIDECTECFQICTSTVSHCLAEGGRHVEAAHLRLLLDCAEICRTSADFMLRGSTLHAETCRACAVACERCAESCSAFAGDAAMERCAEACRRCAASCREMSGGHASAATAGA